MHRQTIIFLFLLILISWQTIPASVDEPPIHEWNKYYSKPYDFSFDNTFKGFIGNIKVWNSLLSSFKGIPDIHYLEIGVNQGRSAIWMLENILTAPSAKLTGIDIFPVTGLKQKYVSNLCLSGAAYKAITIEGFSQVELKKLPSNSFDIIYIDGDHRAKGVLADVVLCFDLLKNGGILIFDDYLWLPNKPVDITPKVAIDSFITSYRDSLEIIHRGSQVFIRKREDRCAGFSPPPIGCSPIGQYVYVWNWNGKNELYPPDLSKPIILSNREKFLIEQLITSTEFGESKLYLDCETLEDIDFIHLKERLQLNFANIALKRECAMIGNACDPLLAEHHWLEAEHADSIVRPLEVANDENASGGKYIYAPNETGNQHVSPHSMATYTVKILQKGQYVLWGRVSASNGKDDTFIIQIDKGLNIVWKVELGDKWHWDDVNKRGTEDPIIFTLTEGIHTLKVKLREDGTKLDKIFLTNCLDFVPSSEGDIAGK